jgi:Putative stress-induced transcription regulator
LTRYDRSVTDHMPSATATSPIALLQSLAETVAADGTDLLDTRDNAVPWLRANGLLPADGVISGSEYNALIRLRDALRETLEARAAGKTDEDAAGRLTRGLADGRLVVAISPDGTARLASSARAPYSNAVAAIAIAVAGALA